MWRIVATTVVVFNRYHLSADYIAIIFPSIALLGLMLPIDDYEAQGISGAVDCDGLLAVMIFVVPAPVIYAAGNIYYVMLRASGQAKFVESLCGVAA